MENKTEKPKTPIWVWIGTVLFIIVILASMGGGEW